jgi:hypothetical protein
VDQRDLSDEELATKGYSKRFTAAEPRLSEAVQFYEALGYEVYVRDANVQDFESEDCSACLDPTSLKTIFTRKRPESK